MQQRQQQQWPIYQRMIRKFRGSGFIVLFVVVVTFVIRQGSILFDSTISGGPSHVLAITNNSQTFDGYSLSQLDGTLFGGQKRLHQQQTIASRANQTMHDEAPNSPETLHLHTATVLSTPPSCIPISSREKVQLTRYPTKYKISNFITLHMIPKTEGATIVDKYNATISDETHAICEFVVKRGSFHFPHGMQQLYRCFGYWQFERQRLLLLQQQKGTPPIASSNIVSSNHEKRLVLIWRSSPRQRSMYLEGIRQLFRDVLDVTEIKNLGESLLSKSDPSSSDKNVPLSVSSSETSSIVVARANWYGGIVRHKDEGYQMNSINDAALLRDATADYYHWHTTTKSRIVRSGCPASWSLPKSNYSNGTLSDTRSHGRFQNKTHPVIGILNRSKRRSITNVVELQQALQNEFKDTPTTVLPVEYMENKTFLQQLEYMNSVDILLTPHGAQLASIPFMPVCGGVLEYFPSGYYYPQFFGTLAAISGLEHATLYLGRNRREEFEKTAYFNETIREASRSKDICVPINQTIVATKVMIEHWQECCFNDPFMKSKFRQQKEQLSKFLTERNFFGIRKKSHF